MTIKSRGRPASQTPQATERRANIHPVIRDFTAWRRKRRLSQVKAAEYAQQHGFPHTVSSLRMWEEGWRTPRPHTLTLLRRFLDDHAETAPRS